MDYYRRNFNVLIKKLLHFVSNYDDYETLLDNDLKSLLNEMNEHLNQLKLDVKTKGISGSDFFFALEDYVLENRDSFEDIIIGLECTKHFTVSKSVIEGLNVFDESLREFISCIETRYKHIILKDAPNPNALNKRFWWRYK